MANRTTGVTATVLRLVAQTLDVLIAGLTLAILLALLAKDIMEEDPFKFPGITITTLSVMPYLVITVC